MNDIDHGLEFIKGFDYVRVTKWLKNARLFADKILNDKNRSEADKIKAGEIAEFASEEDEARSVDRMDHLAAICIQICWRWASIDLNSFNKNQLAEARKKRTHPPKAKARAKQLNYELKDEFSSASSRSKEISKRLEAHRESHKVKPRTIRAWISEWESCQTDSLTE